ncbi:23S rRNA (adenine(1618)-N(6))-methyltransferase RlmF [Vibrio renipiscarius]|uniref:Ribosomal RNA large subunit methyltransferase F n=1 Tax=Vibrio renipiscarius TaxID=1461322 RepID=A0A0C2K1K4_9VIBR|nr:23S rRNA (adenine(1618)-N(6))-methyltransferase RlmF [Vibrio renipiscarius]KII75798.1 23S rRNA methyltransferase [Vibrio renipiscarius]KII81752.1 23S rRNA methyltransferase [Vibrio renipiscarius]
MSKNDTPRAKRTPRAVKKSPASPRPPKKGADKGIKGFKGEKSPSNIVTNITQLKGQSGLHKRNVHQGRYDFERLVKALPALSKHVVKNPIGEATIRFDDPIAVKLLNKALLAEHYSVTQWDIPEGYLCPPIPGRADYIHRLADLVASEAPKLNHKLIRALDVGVGANCIYPIVGATQYGWQCIGSDVDAVSVENSNRIATENAVLAGKVECRLQSDSRHFFQGIIQPGEYYDVTTCNPPFHSSLEEAQKGTERKIANLNAHKAKRGNVKPTKPQASSTKSATLNFGGQKAELWCPGGEATFVKNLALESAQFAAQVLWFSTLISKKDNVSWLCKQLEIAGAKQVTIVEMSQGQKISRFVAWSFKDKAQRQAWLALKSR